MAKKSGRKRQKDTKSQGGPGQRSNLYMGLLSLALALWIVWRLEPTQGLGKALLIGAIVGLAWVLFIVAYNVSQRRGSQKDE